MSTGTPQRAPMAGGSERRCRGRHFGLSGPRPSDLLAAFFAAALVMLIAAAAAAIAYAADGDQRLHWLALHLALLGGVSQLVLGAGQFFVCAFLATSPPPRRLMVTQLSVWNTGTLLVAVGVPTAISAMIDAGGALIVIGLGLFSGVLYAMQRRSLQRARWAVRWYQASAGCLVLGTLAGVLLAGGVKWSYGSLLGAHLALNLAGWLGTAILGTLHTFFPSLTGTRLRFPRLQGLTLALWLLGVCELALAAAFAAEPAMIGAWIELTAAATLLAINLTASLHARSITLSLAARLVTLAQGFLPAGLMLALIATLANGAEAPFAPPILAPLGTLLLVGWIATTVAGSLLHLLAVLSRVRHLTLAMPVARPVRDRALTISAAVSITALALAHVPGMGPIAAPAAVLMLVVAGAIVSRILLLALRATGLPGRYQHATVN